MLITVCQSFPVLWLPAFTLMLVKARCLVVRLPLQVHICAVKLSKRSNYGLLQCIERIWDEMCILIYILIYSLMT